MRSFEMNITSATYSASGNISATINGEVISIPDDLSNRHRQAVAAWESEGNTITPYTPDLNPQIAAFTQAIETELITRTSAGIAYDGRLFSITPTDRNDIAGVIEGARNGIALYGVWGGMPSAPNLLDVSNGLYPIIDFNQLVTWSTDLFALATPLYNTYYAKRSQLRTLTTQAQLDAFDVTAGWSA